jgi:hypothetical protein
MATNEKNTNSEQLNVKLTKKQKSILGSLVGIMGGTEAEVLRSIFMAWLSEKNIINELAKDSIKNV